MYIKNAKLYICSLSNCQDVKINPSEMKSQVSTPTIQSTLDMLHTEAKIPVCSTMVVQKQVSPEVHFYNPDVHYVLKGVSHEK